MRLKLGRIGIEAKPTWTVEGTRWPYAQVVIEPFFHASLNMKGVQIHIGEIPSAEVFGG